MAYFASATTLPADLPSIDAIMTAQDILDKKPRRKVVRVGEHFVVKYGLEVDLTEGETMRFLCDTTTLPVPRIYAYFQDDTTHNNFLIMERIDGDTLANTWHNMNEVEKHAITLELWLVLQQMRNLPAQRTFGRVNGHGMPKDLLGLGGSNSGHFNTEAEFNHALVARYKEVGLSNLKADWYGQVFRRMFHGHQPVFTHADLQRKNIMIRKSQPNLSSHEPIMQSKPEIVIIDWEAAGWYPSYWEYSKAMLTCGSFSDDWGCWLERTLEPFLVEFPWINMFLLEMWS